MEISGAAPLGTKIAYAVPLPDTKPKEVLKVDAKSASTGAGADARDHPDQETHSAASRDLLAMRREVEQGKRPTGPPPSFDVNVLEMDRDLQQKLARMEVDRSKTRDAEAVSAMRPQQPEPDETKAEAEAVEQTPRESEQAEPAAPPIPERSAN